MEPRSRSLFPVHWLRLRLLLYVVIGVALAAAGGGFWAYRNWPFTEKEITSTLEARFAREVVIGRFRQTWFPPGFVADDIRFLHRQRKDLPPLITVRTFLVKTSWLGLLREHLDTMKITGLRITVPPSDASGNSPVMPITDAKSNISSVAQIEADDADVEILSRTTGVQPTSFHIHRLVLQNVAAGRLMPFDASVRTGKPSGTIDGSGKLGPWNTKRPSSTQVSGDYRYTDADLSAFSGLAGKLAAKGGFDGTLAKIQTTGSVDVPEFHVDGSAHNSHLTGDFQASVDTETADTVLRHVEARVGRTIVIGNGQVAGTETAEGKTAALELAVNTGRVEDLLNFFSDEKHPSMTGAVKLRAHVDLPPGDGFLKKVKLTGDFGVAGGRFTNALRQEPVDHLSESARGEKKAQQDEDPRTVLSNLAGHVAIRDGSARLRNVSFDFPGATARMEGTYNLLVRTVDIHGTLQTQGKLSDASSGFKAVMLKVVTPFLKKNRTTVAPFTIGGTSSNPSISLDLHR